MQDFQERVVKEQKELLNKVAALRQFIKTSKFYTALPYDEQGRLQLQLFLMSEYSNVLLDRIDNFVYDKDTNQV